MIARSELATPRAIADVRTTDGQGHSSGNKVLDLNTGFYY